MLPVDVLHTRAVGLLYWPAVRPLQPEGAPDPDSAG